MHTVNFPWLIFQNFLLLVVSWDASDVTWTHEVDTLDLLRTAITTNNIRMFVVDINIGPAPGTQADYMKEPVPLIGSQLSRGDISLNEWLDVLLQTTMSAEHGIKLRFQDPDAIQPALKELRRRDYLIKFPVFLHGEVLEGPVNASSTLVVAPVAGDFLMRESSFLVPMAIVSMGWTTVYERWSKNYRNGAYSWRQVARMANLCRCNRKPYNKPYVSFEIRAVFLRESLDQLKWLLVAVPDSSLTIWSTMEDVVIMNDLLTLRRTFPFDKVYYDLPQDIDQIFRGLKDSIPEPDTSYFPTTLTSNNWAIVPNQRFPDCESHPYITRDAILVEHLTEPLTVLLTDSYDLPVTVHGVLIPFSLFSSRRGPSYVASRFELFYTNVPQSSKNHMTQLQSRTNVFTYTAKDDTLFSDCSVLFTVTFSVNGVVCAITDNCVPIIPGTFGALPNSDCSPFQTIGQGPINIGMSFEGWRGWAVYNLTIFQPGNSAFFTRSTEFVLMSCLLGTVYNYFLFL